MTKSLPEGRYNLVVVGGGAAGLVSAYIAATVRAKVALIERAEMGGDCLNTGCVPSKTLIKTAKVAAPEVAEVGPHALTTQRNCEPLSPTTAGGVV